MSSFLDVPALAPPPGVVPNFQNPHDDGYIIIVVGSILLVIMTLFLANRFYTKFFIVKKASWDDLTCALAALGAIAYFTTLAIGVTRGPLGKHQWDVTLSAIADDTFLIAVAFLSAILLSPTLCATKLTLFLLYLQLFRPLRWLRVCVYVGATFTALFYGASGIAQIVLASPKHGESWLIHALSQEEIIFQRLSVPFSAVGLVIDLYLLILPLKAVAGLQLPPRRKIGVILIFLTGLLACIASVLSIYYRVEDNRTYDTTWATANVVLTGLVEMYIGVIVSCMPSFSNAIQHHLPIYRSLKSALSSRISSLRAAISHNGSSHSKFGTERSDSSLSSKNSEPIRKWRPIPSRPVELASHQPHQINGVKTHIGTEVVKPVEDDRIHLKQEIWQDR